MASGGQLIRDPVINTRLSSSPDGPEARAEGSITDCLAGDLKRAFGSDGIG
jgi:hypothetical protein